MALCLNCGNNIDLISRTCPYCGALIQTDSVTSKEAVKDYGKSSHDNMGIIVALSFIIPVLGFVMYSKNKDNVSYMQVLKYSLIGTIVYLFIITILIVKFLF